MAADPRRPGITALSLAGLLAFWSLLAIAGGDPEVLPPPWRVAPLIYAEAASGELARHLVATLRRVAMAYVIAMSLGMAIGMVMGLSRRANQWLDPWLIVFLNLPALVTIVLAYLWIGLNEVAAVMAVALNKIPTVIVTIREGARALDPRLNDMARVFRLSRLEKLRHVALPQLAPFIASAGRSGIALIWKIVLVVEFLGRSDGIGFKIHLYFQLFDVGMVFAYAISFIAVMLLIEALVLQPWEARASRWRRA
ncbi:ABC transporter permease [Actibacterium sp. MT2.3-13A]|uniref:ABC transporter permease n=1 Tax=Actibacterium sp. MT2.3-13A TaxID=2828332 RepID=UPI001BA70A13|nr:ABC transporter permease [Actibacterium sp. MT2.3-13A]